jgi:two-component system, chemotaxis family, chemotaxis protein CheY
MQAPTFFARPKAAELKIARDNDDRGESRTIDESETRCESEVDTIGSGQVPRVLVVEDDQAIRMLCAFNLKAAGLSVLEAADGEEGLELARTEHPDLVLSDVSMPGLDGFELAEALQRYEDTRGIPIAFMTGHLEESYEARARELGAVAILRKPFDPETLASVALSVVA